MLCLARATSSSSLTPPCLPSAAVKRHLVVLQGPAKPAAAAKPAEEAAHQANGTEPAAAAAAPATEPAKPFYALYIKNLPVELSREDLIAELEKYGPLFTDHQGRVGIDLK